MDHDHIHTDGRNGDQGLTHSHHHHHHHHHHHEIGASLNRAFRIGIWLNAGFVVAEAVFGFIYDSMGLLSDAGHNLSDVFALLLSMIAFRLSGRKPDERHTYGYRKFTIQASLINAIVLLLAVGAILAESIDKLVHPVAVDGGAIAWVAGAGVVVNGLTAWLFLKDKEKDMNVKGAYLHMLADTLVSVGVVASGVVIRFTGWYFIDPIIGIVIAIFIGWSTRDLLVESFRLSIDSVPKSVDLKKLSESLCEVPGVAGIHHLHVWALSTTQNAMTVHAVVETPERFSTVVAGMHEVASGFGIDHSTVEVETETSQCDDHNLISAY